MEARTLSEPAVSAATSALPPGSATQDGTLTRCVGPLTVCRVAEQSEREGGVDARATTLATLAGAGVVLYGLIDVALAFLRPGLSLIHHPESDYGVGPYSWLMDLNFLLRAGLSLSLVAALTRVARRSGPLRAGLWLVGGWAVASGLLAYFPDDPLGTPVTLSGKIHLLLALIAFLCAAAGTLVLSLRVDYLARLRPLQPLLIGISTLAVLALLALGRVGFGVHSDGGLMERLFLGLELLWILVVAVRIAHRPEVDEQFTGAPT